MEAKHAKKKQSQIKKEQEHHAQEYLDGWKRERAEFENYRRQENERAQQLQVRAKRMMLASLLPILDSFELALKHTPEETRKEQWFKGYEYIKKQFDDMLTAEGISIIEETGKEFNPQKHEAVESEGEGDTMVVGEVLQKGYAIGEQVLRPARVKVIKTEKS